MFKGRILKFEGLTAEIIGGASDKFAYFVKGDGVKRFRVSTWHRLQDGGCWALMFDADGRRVRVRLQSIPKF